MATTQDGRLLSVATPLPYDFLLIEKVHAREGLSQLFRFEFELVHEENEIGYEPTIVDPQEVLGQPMNVRAIQADGATRYFDGICIEFRQGDRNSRFSTYRAEVVPHVWLLTQNSQCRIFQNMSVPDVLEKVLKGFPFDNEIRGTFEPRNYIVQYRETDWDFASRLMEEEGIFYYFEHGEESHKLILANSDASHRDAPTKHQIPYWKDTSELEDWVGKIQSWRFDNKLLTGRYTMRDYNFQLPLNMLEVEQLSRFNIGSNQSHEVFDFPGGYAKRFDGIDLGGNEQSAKLQKVFDDRRRTSKIRQEEIDVSYKTIEATSDCCSITAGYRFKLTQHPHKENNRNHVIVSAQTEATQSPIYMTGEVAANAYYVRFSCIPQGEGQAPYRPPRQTPRPVIQGNQTAIVVGPAGEEIFTDKYGRVKVQFHWDRDGQVDANSSCWLRVSQPWAGNKWGSMFLPRIGMEVLVNFIEGDPDQPIIVGCVYNPASMPPYALPEHKTMSTIKSNSSKGGKGFNELRFEDKKGKEQIFVHAEKDQDIRVKADRREFIGNDRHLKVYRDKREQVDRDSHIIIKQDLVEEIDRDHHRHVKGKVALKTDQSISHEMGSTLSEKIGQDHYEECGMNFHVKAGMTLILEAGMQISLKVGGSFIDINPTGVTISGPMVLINSGGAAGSVSPIPTVTPKEPEKAHTADNADPGSDEPTYKNEKRHIPAWKVPSLKHPHHKPKSPSNKKKKSWIEVELVDETGQPVPGELYRITLPDGTTLAEGTLNEKGFARVDHIDPGTCKVTFPRLDKEAWKPK